MAPMDDDKLDLSPLDPTRDARRFEHLVRSVAAQATARRDQGTPALVVRLWAPALALAASLALAAWLPSLLKAAPAADQAASRDPAGKLLQWARGDSPSAGEVLDSLGGNR